MNIIKEIATDIVWYQSQEPITELNNNYFDVINTGIPVDGFQVIFNANDLTFQAFFPQTYTYIDGVWAIGNQTFYDEYYDELYATTAKPVLLKRNLLLQETDWTQIPNNPLTTQQQEAWAVYRQELRDITSEPNYPFTVVFPNPPS